jgi:hypothetical protein
MPRSGLRHATVGRATQLGALAMLVGSLVLAPATSVAATDTDHDGLPDTYETGKTLTNPRLVDTDRDGIRDGLEDPDRDGLWNRTELAAGTNPRKADTDGDGRSDAIENPDGDGLGNLREQVVGTSPGKADTDGDGIRDEREDPDTDGLWSITDFNARLDPKVGDTNHDGLRDGVEDTDEDGLPNVVEQRTGTNPGKADSDGDHLGDALEDADHDALPNREELVRGTDAVDPDSDHDGTPDGAEDVPAADAPVLPGAPGCTVFPADNVWNERIDARSVADNSATLIASIGASRTFHMDFGSYEGYGIPFQVVGAATPRRTVTFDYADESDPGPYPIPEGVFVEGGSDRHVILVDRDACRLYELFAVRQASQTVWRAGSGAQWGLASNALRPAGWTSADAAGLPILPGLVRYDEVVSGAIAHALRFTAPQTRAAYIYPARHEASSSTSSSLPPMGLRVRLKASANLEGLSPQARVIAVALQHYGMILADNGSPWYVSGMSDPRFDDDVLHELDRFTGANLEVVNTSGLLNGP